MEVASALTALRGATYLGSHPRASRRVLDVDIEFTDSGVTLRRGRRQFGAPPWDNITKLARRPRTTARLRA